MLRGGQHVLWTCNRGTLNLWPPKEPYGEMIPHNHVLQAIILLKLCEGTQSVSLSPLDACTRWWHVCHISNDKLHRYPRYRILDKLPSITWTNLPRKRPALVDWLINKLVARSHLPDTCPQYPNIAINCQPVQCLFAPSVRKGMGRENIQLNALISPSPA